MREADATSDLDLLVKMEEDRSLLDLVGLLILWNSRIFWDVA